MTIEDLVREAAGRQAERAAPAERILTGLPARIALARRRRRIGVATGAALVAAAVAAAIAVPSLVVERDDPVVTPPPPPSTSADVPLGYRPGWVPGGFTEKSRAWTADLGRPGGAKVSRRWKMPTTKVREEPSLELEVWPDVADVRRQRGTFGDPIDVNGAEGDYWRSSDGVSSQLSWSPGGHVVLRLTARDVNVGRDVLLRMAKSVAPDPSTLNPPVRLRSLPDGWSIIGADVNDSEYAPWKARLSLRGPRPDDPKAPPRSISITVDGDNELIGRGGAKVTVAGRPARLRPYGPALTVDLGDKRVLVVEARWENRVDPDLLLRVAENVEVTGTGVGWLGGR